VAQGAIYRRPANTHQRAIIAAKIANAVGGGYRREGMTAPIGAVILSEAAKKANAAGGGYRRQGMMVPDGTITRKEAAKKANISPRGKLRERGPWPFAAPRN